MSVDFAAGSQLMGIRSRNFYHLTNLTSITIPSDVTFIDNIAFDGCSGLTSITIPASVTSIGEYVCRGCFSIADVYCYATPGEMIWGLYPSEFKADKATRFHVADASVWEEKFPDANVTFVSDLDDYFVEDNLRYRVLHQTEARASMHRAEGQNIVEFVGYKSVLTGAVDIPATVNHDGVDYAVTSIGESAFANCRSMTSVTIPSSVTNIEDSAFEGCTGLTDVYCNSDPAQLTWNADAQSFMANKATKFHVTDASAWEEQFADANVTFVDDKAPDSDAIESVTSADASNGAWYNLNGMRLKGKPVIPGVYMKDGKKVMVK